MSDSKSVAEEALASIPPPGKDAEGDYSAAEDSMKALMDALKGDDVQAALDAWDDVKKNC